MLFLKERRRLITEWNDTKREYPGDKSIHELCEAQVEQTPDAVAVVFPSTGFSRCSEDKELTYRELNRRANQLGHHLQKLGVGPEVLVGICMERSLEMVIGLLGILKAGGAYVPLDPEYPKQRLAFMLEDAEPKVLLTQSKFLSQLPERTADGRQMTDDVRGMTGDGRPVTDDGRPPFSCRSIVLGPPSSFLERSPVIGPRSSLPRSAIRHPTMICLDTGWAAIERESEENPVCEVTADNLAYMIYTSGSTGRPKGVMNTHRGICNRLLWMQDVHRLTRADRVLQKTPFSFDVSVWEFFWPLLFGARLIMARPGGHRDNAYLVRLITEQEITTLHFVPSMLRVFLEEQGIETCNCLKHVICSGEVLPFELQERFFARLDAALHNLYGPTEASVDVTSWACKRGSDQRIVPIGRPIANTQIYLLDSHLQPVPVGVLGELHIGGVSLGRGYLNRPDSTAEKFIPNPFSDEPGARLYKSGDLARYLPDGNIEFFGRIDNQVKIRGVRVELGEIEAVLRQHPAVQAAVAVAREDASTEKHLVAYVVPEQDQPPAISELRRFLREKLPQTMVPAAVVILDTLPLTPNGKADRRALAMLGMTEPVLTAAEQQLLAEWNDTKVDNPRDKCIHQLFEEQAERAPHAVAVVCERKQLTYAQLNTKANQLARRLQALGVGPEVLVAVCIERSLEMTVALLGILKAGAAYVPLDPAYPKERLAFMLAETQAPVLLTQCRLVAGLPKHATKVVCLDVEWDVIAKENVESPSSGVTVDNLAYVVYTSGSTGKPKGVAMSHRSLGNLLWWQVQNSTLTHGARTLQFASLSFDVSCQEIFSTWCSGGTLVLISDELRRDAAALLGFLKDESVERLFVPFVALQQLAAIVHGRGAVPVSLREIIAAGEQLQVTPHVASLFRNLKDCTLYNQYGPSESHVVTAFTFTGSPSDWPALPPIGRPIANTQVYVLDASWNQVPVGAPGELHIGGVGLARGYLNRPDLTAEKFIPNPFSDEPGARLYKSGDLARYLPDGNIEFLGRLDHQVKIRGFRVELGEVEAVLRQHPAVREAVVVAQENESGDPSASLRTGKRLLAYVVLRKEAAARVTELRGFLKEKLPHYMVPSAFVLLEALPLTPNGKVDRHALPAFDPHRSELAGTYVEPHTVTERLLAGIWAEVLHIAQIGANDDFFALGGHSLKATFVIARILEMFGVELSHRCFFEAPTLAALAQRIDRSRPRPPTTHSSLIETVRSDAAAPLSWGQTEIWLTAQLEPSVPVFNEPFTIYMNGPVDPVALEKALNEIIRRHDILRTAFTTKGEQPIQEIQDEVRLTLSVADLRSLPESDREGEAFQLVTAEARRPFNLAEPPLVRATLARMSETDSRLYLTVHHIVVDAYSIYNVFIPELWQLYESRRAGKQSRLRELPAQYADYARWQRRQVGGAELEKCLNYWKKQLDGAAPLELPTDRPRPRVRTFRGAYQPFAVSKELTDALNTLSRQEGVTLYMMLLAAFKTLLWRYTQQDEIVVGTAEAGRNRPEFEPLLGYFLNILVLRSRMADDPMFRHFLQRVREMALDAYAHRNLPFAKLVEELRPKRDSSRHPLFQVAFVMEPTMVAQESGWTISQFDVQTGTSKFDLTLELEERADGIIGRFEYNSDLFNDETIRSMIGHLQALLEGIAATPHRRISELPLLTPQACIHQLFEAQVKTKPDGVAVIDGDFEITYRQLNEQANQLAHHLRALGAAPNTPVAVCMDRSADLIVSLLATLKAGGAYVPLDPEYPRERLQFMMKDSGARILLADRDLTAKLAMSDAVVIRFDTDTAAIHAQPNTNPRRCNGARDLAYVMYTSGSTGQPKGVEVSHRAVVRLVFGIDDVPMDEQQRILLLSPISFDASTFELWGPLLHGATCVVYPQRLPELHELERVLKKQRVSCLWLTAALFNLVIDQRPEALASVSHLIIGGEALSVPHVRRALQLLPNTRIVNGYGPTESATFTCTYAIPRNLEPAVLSIPIGRPIADTRVYVLDKDLKPVPNMVTGELHIGGEGLAGGYRRRPGLTAEKFIPNPFSDEPGARLYKTGDLARYLPDGNIEFLGRIDHQVKIRGFRVELGEIEAVLGQHPAVRQVVVVAKEDRGPTTADGEEGGGWRMAEGEGDNSRSAIRNPHLSGKRLVGYVVPSQERTSASELRRFLKEKLPYYMVPSAFVFLQALPLTPSGKVDREGLPPPEHIGLNLEKTFVAPRTPVERRLADTWREVLGLERVDIHDNFFDLGGHSLSAAQFQARLSDIFHVDLSLRCIFENPTVAGLALQIEEVQAKTAVPAPAGAAIVHSGNRDSVPTSFAQQRLWLLDQLEPRSAVYNIPYSFKLTGPLDVAILERSFSEIVRRHEVLRTTFSFMEGQPVQVIAPAEPFKLALVDLQGVPEAEAEVRRLSAEEAQRPFDLARGPLMRASLLRLGAWEHGLLLTMHHIVSDGWSMGILFRELSVLYEAFSKGDPSPLPELAVQYANFAVWQRQWLHREVLEEQLSYWRERLGGAPPLLILPTDRPRPAAQTYRGARQSIELPKGLSEALKELSRREGVTLFMTLLAAFQTLLYRYTGQGDIVVGAPIAGRNRIELEGLIGFFVNTLVLRADLSGSLTFRELLGRVREVCLGAYAHQDLPFEKLVEELQPERNLSHAPLFQVMFAFQNFPRWTLEMSGLTVSWQKVDSGTTKFDLTLQIDDEAQKLRCVFEYNTDLFEGYTIARMLGHFQSLLEGFVANPDLRLGDVSLLTRADERRLLVEWNDTKRDYAREKCVHELFEEQAERTPDTVAVVFEDQELTYREANRRADQVAHYLKKLGVEPEVLVGICMERSIEMVVGLLGILKAGGAYVPLDPEYPEERLAFMLEDAQPKVLLTQSKLLSQLPEMTADGRQMTDEVGGMSGDRRPVTDDGRPPFSPRSTVLGPPSSFLQRSAVIGPGSSLPQSAIRHPTVVFLDAGWEAISPQNDASRVSGQNTDSLGYVIYTSGSTGNPKGVAVEHRQLLNYCVEIIRRLNPAVGNSFAMVQPLTFDSSITVIFASLLTGGTLHVLSRERAADPYTLGDYFFRWPIDFLKITPSHLAALQSSPCPKQFMPRRCLVIGGEESRWDWVQSLQSLAPKCNIVNHYGPTETTVGVLTYRIEKGEPNQNYSKTPLGRPIANTQVFLLDSRLQPVPIGSPGELHIGGDNLARGYLNRPELTAERFVPSPFSSEPGARLYKTGDLARYLPDGNVEFLGRIDHQVKIRGFRVEVGEIEAVLRQHPAVREAAVLAREDMATASSTSLGTGRRLVAYVIPNRDRAPTVGDKRRYKLPNGMAVAQLNKNETDYMYQEIFERQAYLKHGVTINDGDCIFDVGANIGLFMLFVHQICRHPRVYSFEPNPAVFEILKDNACLYGPEVKLFAFGLSNEAKTATFTFFPGFSLLSGFYADATAEKEVVKTFMLNQQRAGVSEMGELLEEADDILDQRFSPQIFTAQLRNLSSVIEQQQIECIDLLKINVEKGELDVLTGIRDGDWTKIKQIVVEVDVKENLDIILSLLDRHGYEFVVEQDVLLENTQLCYVYAIRPSEDRRLVKEEQERAHIQPIPVLHETFLSIDELRSFLKQKLPDYMVPSAFVFLDSLPLTLSGKVDRRALPAPGQSRPELESPFVAPRTPVEEDLARIWTEVLKLERVGVHDNFFDLGGHSLLATQLISRVRDAFKIELPLRSLFESPTVAELAERIGRTRGNGVGQVPLPILPVAIGEEYPLSFAQERFWFLNQLEPNNLAYRVSYGFRLTGPLNIEALEQSLIEIVRRHETLHTTVQLRNEKPVQVIAEQWSFRISVLDLSQETPLDLDSEVQRLFEGERRRPFDLSTDLLLRATVLRLSADEHVLFLNSHHIAWDHWCIEVFFRELSVLYQAFAAGQSSPLPQLSIQYKHYALWQRKAFRGRELESHLAYWKEQLSGAPPSLNLPTDYPRKPLGNRRGECQSALLPNGLSEELKTLSRKAGVSFFMTLLAAFQTLLHRMTGQDDIVVGTPVAGRDRSETEGLIGLFLNSLALRTDLSGNPTFLELLSRIREVALGAYDHQDLPFEKLVEELQPERDLTQTPIFQVFINMYNFKEAGLELGHLSVKRIEAFEPAPQFDVEFNIREHDDGTHLIFAYDTDLFHAATIARMLGHFQVLLRGIVSVPERRLSDLPILTEAEKHQLLVEWNDTGRDYPRGKCLHRLFEEQVERTPEAVAVVFEDQRLTYRELNRRANQLAHHLQKLGVGPEVLVGICMERSLEMVVEILGILKAGGAYVPIDPTYPKERLAFVLEDAQAPVLLTQHSMLGELPPLKGRAVCLDADWEVIAAESGENPVTEVTSDNLAYVIYTSGSTGKPKGVAIAHHSTVALLYWARTIFTREELRGVLASTSICFDLSVFELFVPLSWGGKAILAKNVLQLPTLVASKEVSLINTVPSAMVEILRVEGVPTSVRTVNLAGEPLRTSLVKQIYEQGTIERVFDLYGPSEDTTYSTFALRNGNGPATIGRPIANTQVYLLDSHQQPVPVGIAGELYIGGDGLARGYLNRPELTAEKFTPNPFSSEPGARLYRTGDLARYLPDGNIEFLGRIDNQVKIRGFRIELGEIESVLRQHTAVREAVVMAREEPAKAPSTWLGTGKRLVAYVAPHQEQILATNELREFLKQKLPEYMIPSAFVLLDALPLTPNGKVDRRALPAPDGSRPELEKAFVAPRTTVEELLAQIWSQVLRIERVGIYDNFFDLGGHSLLATQVISRLRNAFQMELPLHALFRSPTVAGLAVEIVQAQVKTVAPEQMADLLDDLESLSDEEAERLLVQESPEEI